MRIGEKQARRKAQSETKVKRSQMIYIDLKQSRSTQGRENAACTVEKFECTVSDFSLSLAKKFHVHIRQIITKVPIKVHAQ